MNIKYEEDAKAGKYRFIPIILMMGLIPVIVHMYQYNCGLSQFDWFPDDKDMQIDFFFAWKMYMIIGTGVLMLLVLGFRHMFAEDKFKFEKPFVLLGVYFLLVVVSAILSKYQHWVAHGSYDLFEPVWVVIAYLILCYYTYNFVQEEQQVDMILRWSGIGMAVVTLLGVFQYAGHDLFMTDFGKKLISNKSYWNDLDSMSITFGKGTVYTTLYNPNFLSFYFGMLISLLMCLFIGAKKIWHKVLIAIAEVLCLICLKGSGSSSGWMALAITGGLLVLLLLSRKKKTMIFGVVFLVAGIAASLVFMNTTSMGKSIKNTIVGTYHLEDKYDLHNIETGTDNITLDINGNNLLISVKTEEDGTVTVSCVDADEKKLSLKEVDTDAQIYTIEDKRFEGVKVQPLPLDEESDIPCVFVTVDDTEWMFLKIENGGYYFINSAAKPVKYEQVETAHLFNEDAMSGRGRIWNNTIPLLKKHILIGSGANTFLFEYPQNDYIVRNYIYSNGINVKAHSWYLQQWVENGMLATLALIAFLGWYVVRSIRIYRRVDLHQRLSWIGLGLFAAVLLYLITALANDSNVCTAPVFWGMLGLGLAVNRMLVEKEKLFQKAEEGTEVKKRVF